jgi:hypothetical protein
MYGTISVNEMALSGIKMFKNDGIKGYEINSDLRFNFGNKVHTVQKGKLNRFLDTLQTQKKNIPSPDKYTG